MTLSNGTPSHSVTSCAKLVSWPCPEDMVPITSSTRPSGSTVISVRSRGAPLGDLDTIGGAYASQLAAFPCFSAAGWKSFPVGERQCRVHCVLVAEDLAQFRNRVLYYSPLEEGGFELPVPRAVEARCRNDKLRSRAMVRWLVWGALPCPLRPRWDRELNPLCSGGNPPANLALAAPRAVSRHANFSHLC